MRINEYTFYAMITDRITLTIVWDSKEVSFDCDEYLEKAYPDDLGLFLSMHENLDASFNFTDWVVLHLASA